VSADDAAVALYEQLLGRGRDEVDPEGLRATVDAITAGRVADRVAAMLDSPEFAEKFARQG
jgi:hypothetical protein